MLHEWGNFRDFMVLRTTKTIRENCWFHIIGMIFSCLLTTTSHAKENNKHPFVVYDRGQDSCGQFIEARRFSPEENRVYSIWLAGYFSAYNYSEPDTVDIINLQNPTDPSPMAGPMAWIERYCNDNPMSSFMSAVISFTTNQYPNRKK